MPTPGQTLDGYSLIRRIGQGGFGEVWLCRAPVTGEWRALKWVPESDGAALGKEHEALMSYRRLTARLRSPHLMPVEHVNRSPGGLFYTMPLSSGLDGDDPESPDWTPKTLAAVIERRRARPGWFSSEEIKKIIGTVLDGLQVMADAGVVHRDVKPENVLFFGERPCLADISLLTHDRTQMTRHGTPGYSTPSWYEGGHYDMYGAAALLYTLLTGNAPDRMGRSAFTGPPCGEASLTPEERADRVRLHAVIRRATEERPECRYPDFATMRRAVAGESMASPAGRRFPRAYWGGLVLLLGLGAGAAAYLRVQPTPARVATSSVEALMEKITPYLEENERAARQYDAKITELLEFYETKAPDVLSALRGIAQEAPGPEEMERRLDDVAPKLKDLVRPQWDMRDDPLIPLTPEESRRRFAEWKKLVRDLKPGEARPLTTLLDARMEVSSRWANAYEAASKIPQELEEQLWFEKRVSAKFYVSPNRASRKTPPMETLWFIRADKSGVMKRLADGELRKQVEQITRVVGLYRNSGSMKPKSNRGTWNMPGSSGQTVTVDSARVARLESNLVALMRSAIWVELQTKPFMDRSGDAFGAPTSL